MSNLRSLTVLALAAVAIVLGACSADLSSLANDPATVSIHQVVQAPAWSITTDVTRVNSTGTAASAAASGTTVNVPAGSVVNTGPAKTSVSTATSTTPSSPAVGTTVPAPTQTSTP